jgi:plastocyanin
MRIAMITAFSTFAFTGAALAQQPQPAPVVSHFAGCTDADYVTVDRNIVVTTVGSSYSPKCLKVKVGATVLIAASTIHPVQGKENSANQPVNPIFDDLGAKVSNTNFTFTNGGEFGYYCVAHGTEAGRGMAGSIIVVEPTTPAPPPAE